MTAGQQTLNQLLKKALERGASMAGYVPAERLRDCPSSRAAGPQGFQTISGTIVVLGLYHDPDRPELDWWEKGRGTPGDRMLRRIIRELGAWLEREYGIRAADIPYQISDGGIYLKDAAILAGLGCMGRNNLVITPGFGPRVRFRALWVDIETEATAPPAPEAGCAACDHPCEDRCPQNALEGGAYSRSRCMARMDADKAAPARAPGRNGRKGPVGHCRICELVCRAARKNTG